MPLKQIIISVVASLGVFLLIAILVTNPGPKSVAGSPKLHGKEYECLGGVAYYKSHYSSTPAFKPDGSLYTCED